MSGSVPPAHPRSPRMRGALRRIVLRGFAAASLALACLAAPAAADLGGPYAMHSMLELNSPYAFKQDMFAAAAAAHASEIRVDVSLGALNNPWISQAMWQGVDDYMSLSRAYDMPVLMDLNGSNDGNLETCPAGASPSAGLCGIDPSNLAGYYNEVAAL